MKGLLIALIAILTTGAAPIPYAEGQVWTYKVRSGDEASLLKIQSIEQAPDLETIYHISVIGVRLANSEITPVIAHVPVSKMTLDASVRRLAPDPGTFPSAAEGIKEWRNAEGGAGVFTISVAEIVQLLDDASSRTNPA